MVTAQETDEDHGWMGRNQSPINNHDIWRQVQQNQTIPDSPVIWNYVKQNNGLYTKTHQIVHDTCTQSGTFQNDHHNDTAHRNIPYQITGYTRCMYGWETWTGQKGNIIMKTIGQLSDRYACMRRGWPKKQPHRRRASHRWRRQLGARCVKIQKKI